MNKGLRSIFSLYHPSVQLLYLVAVLFCAMFTLQPFYVILSFGIGTIYSIFLNGVTKYLKMLRLILFMFFIIVIVNPLTNHRGNTVLFTLFDEKITLESLLYGLCSGGMLMAVFVWFQCYQALITNDKFMFLFGRIAPTSSMVVSMIMNFIPMTTKKYHEIAYAQKGIESVDGIKKKKKMDKLKNSIRIAGILMSRCLEDSIETAASMKSRGYGCEKRSHFSKYTIMSRDVISLVVLMGLFVYSVIGIVGTNAKFNFFPAITAFEYGVIDIIKFALYIILLLYPLIIEAKDVWIKERLTEVRAHELN